MALGAAGEMKIKSPSCSDSDWAQAAVADRAKSVRAAVLTNVLNRRVMVCVGAWCMMWQLVGNEKVPQW